MKEIENGIENCTLDMRGGCWRGGVGSGGRLERLLGKGQLLGVGCLKQF